MLWVPDGVGYQYDERGWPTFEKMISSLIKDPANVISMRENTILCETWDEVFEQRLSRCPPVTPEKFAAVIEAKHITSEKDPDFLKMKYSETFGDVIASTDILSYVSLEWTDDAVHQLSAIFSHCAMLEQIILSHNNITRIGAMHLATAAADCPSLVWLDLTDNPIDDEAYGEIREAWVASGKQVKHLLLAELESTEPFAEATIPLFEQEEQQERWDELMRPMTSMMSWSLSQRRRSFPWSRRSSSELLPSGSSTTEQAAPRMVDRHSKKPLLEEREVVELSTDLQRGRRILPIRY